jgi:hypothetical protein
MTKIKQASSNKRLYFVVVFAIVLLIASTIVNVLLSQKVRELTTLLNESQSQNKLKEGDIVLPFHAKDLQGNDVNVSFSSSNQPTVFYIFTPQCH